MARFREEQEIRLKTAQEGRKEAEILAKSVAVGSLLEAATHLGMDKGASASSAVQDPKVIL